MADGTGDKSKVSPTTPSDAAPATPGAASINSMSTRVQVIVDGETITTQPPEEGKRLTEEEIFSRLNQQATWMRHTDFLMLNTEDYLRSFVIQQRGDCELLQQRLDASNSQREALSEHTKALNEHNVNNEKELKMIN